MAEEPPGGWELKRAMDTLREDIRTGFNVLNVRLDSLDRDSVGVREYVADKKRLEDRISELRNDHDEFKKSAEAQYNAMILDQKQTKQWSVTTAISAALLVVTMIAIIVSKWHG